MTHHFDLRRVHHFADREQAEFISSFAHQFQARFAHSLKCIRRGARLERSRAQNLCAGFGNRFCHRVDLFAGFHRTRTGGNNDFGATDFYAAPQIDNCAFGFELPAGKFEGLRNAHDFAHTFQQLKIAMIEIAVYPNSAKHRVRRSRGAVHIKTLGNQLVDDVLNLGVRRALLHDDDHWVYTIPFRLNADRLTEISWRAPKRSMQCKLNSRIAAGAALRVDFSIRILVHGGAFRGTRFVDDALK